tara:strand:+ start:509 stop:946 length:438 start_codon:yes stop_codon:yes gene_type:complete
MKVPPLMSKSKNVVMKKNVFLVLRLGVGMSMFGHGLVRLPKLSAFASWMSGSFQQTMLPEPLVHFFGLLLPIMEFSLGLLLLIGLFTRQAASIGALLMLILLFGTCMLENWEAIPSQMIHLLFLALLLQFVDRNSFSLDNSISNL